ncbi:MAG: ABC transporter permease [Thermoplasmatota archaeon]
MGALRVIRAGLLKNWRLSTSYASWVLNRIIGPFATVALTVFAYTGLVGAQGAQDAFARAGESGSFTGFLILGQTVFSFFTGMNWRGGMSIQRERWMGTLELVLLSPASRVAFVLGESLFGLIDSGWTVFLAMAIAFLLFGASFHVSHPLVAVAVVLATLAAMVALGLFFAGFYIMSRAAGPMSNAIQQPVRFLSGTQFPVTALPGVLQAVSYALPVTYGLAAVRRVLLLGGDLSDVAQTLATLAGITALFAALGVFLLGRMEKRAKRTGSLHAY